jgi:methylphosphotriester-DNA--protein-cysteine methyltransferase
MDKVDPWVFSKSQIVSEGLKFVWESQLLNQADVEDVLLTTLSDLGLEISAGDISPSLGASVSEIIEAMRAEKARELIEGGANLEQAAHEAGIDNLTVLDNIFEKCWMLSPSEYRAEALGRRR